MEFSEVFRSGQWKSWPKVKKVEKLLFDSACSNEALSAEAWRLTRQYFGRTMRLFAPVYLSNECINNCAYCGFSRDNPIFRVTLSVDEVEAEVKHLWREGFRSVLLVAGEHPKFVSQDYLVRCVERARKWMPSVAIEVGPMEVDEYVPIVGAGAEGLVVYQETYHREIYATLHTAGPKRNFDWRLDCPSRGSQAGFRRIGVGALLGLAPWETEMLALSAHVEYLLRRAWRSQLTISLPRLRPAAGGYEPKFPVSDETLVRMILTLRIVFPQVGIVLSTREPAALRDQLMTLGVTMMSAGSHTEPGGYTGAGRDNLHLTERGRRVDLAMDQRRHAEATEQFVISDERSAGEVALALQARGIEPVWKDWDWAL
ncbi:MAG: 2-iminoacetate synthase ThiH [Methylacidiphilales bacterium]|nr:2-iminoacetate synthase ThiH [Candidatus Methylacidiphilales bacterium]MDW8348857.1 2-iminoacetate synthase ThiH [Verrucomicrobiae bacterium]